MLTLSRPRRTTRRASRPTRWVSARVADNRTPDTGQLVHLASTTVTGPLPRGYQRTVWSVSAIPWTRNDGPLLRGWLGSVPLGNGAHLYDNAHGLAVVRSAPVWDHNDQAFVWVAPIPDHDDWWTPFVARAAR